MSSSRAAGSEGRPPGSARSEATEGMVQGEALERGQVDFNMLEDYINNPERQVSEAEKLGACVCPREWHAASEALQRARGVTPV